MHAGDSLCTIGKDLEDLGLGQAVLQTGVHEVNQTTAAAVFHQEEDLVSAALELAGMAVDVGDDMLVALELLHGLDFGAHVGQMLLVGHSDALQHGNLMLVVVAGHAHDVDMRKAALGQVFLNVDLVAADRDFCVGQKGARRL